MTRRPWTDAEREEVRRRYPDEVTADIGRDINRSVGGIYDQANKMGLKKSLAFMRRVHGCVLTKAGEYSRFSAGLEPWNKGVPGVTGHHPNTVRTQFKPGRKPEDARNYKPIGTLRICKDGYLERKVTDDQSIAPARRWVGVHRLVWEETNGPIPKGHAVVFRPGKASTDVDAITIDAVELISRAELMRRNTRHNLPPELNALISTKARLTRLINERDKDNELQH